MPVLAGIHLAIALFFAVHAVRTGRDKYWIFVLFAFPALGSLLYFFTEYLGELRHSRSGRRAIRALQGVVNPQRELREAQQEFDRTPTAFNEARLARAWLAQGDAVRAVEIYRRVVSGPYASDASFLKGLAIAQMEAGRGADAVATLETLFAAHPEQRAGDLALMYAEALAAAGRPQATQAFESVIASDSSLEARCKYAQFLLKRGQADAARRAFEQVVADARRGNKHSRELNREWIDAAQTALQQLAPQETAASA
jgi:hypothetical protein